METFQCAAVPAVVVCMKQARALYEHAPVEVSTGAFFSPTTIARLGSWSRRSRGQGMRTLTSEIGR